MTTYHLVPIIFLSPDPISVLEQALIQQQRLQQSQDHEVEVKQLRETLQEYNVEFAHVKNQEGTIQKLREQIKEMEDRMEEMAVVSFVMHTSVPIWGMTDLHFSAITIPNFILKAGSSIFYSAESFYFLCRPKSVKNQQNLLGFLKRRTGKDIPTLTSVLMTPYQAE